MPKLLSIFLLLALFSANIFAQTVTGFTLLNAASDEAIGPLAEGQTINLSETGYSLNITAEVTGTIGSLRFALDGNDNFQTENLAPYALAGNNGDDYNSWTPALGEHTLTASIYAGTNASGGLLNQQTITFFVVEDNGGGEIVFPDDPGTGEVTISGELQKWHKITLNFAGPAYAEQDVLPNPFMDYRMNVSFSNGSQTMVVPGYFAADGNAAESSASSGNVWRVHFAPEQTGEWTYVVSFRIGLDVAISDDPAAGEAITPLDGATGSFVITESDKLAPDNRARGRLQYVGEHYLQYAETGQYFIKGGADAPENFLAYDDIDNTPNYGNRRKSWSPHADDWQSGDPSWQDGKGTEIIGAVNYLASKGLNVFSFLTMNIQGDDRNVFPYVNDANFEHFDCSKLDQWEIIFAHADALGMYLHFKTQETENDQLLDGGAVGRTRQLYYRELLARFGHHLALNWNMGEENTQTPAQRLEMATWWAEHDPYNHHRVIHTYPGQTTQVYNPLLVANADYTGISLQTNWNNVHNETAKWVLLSSSANQPWVVANDEQNSANIGVPPDPGYPGYNGSTPELNAIRREVLWGNLMAGGAGVEYYFGYQQPESDLTLQDFRSRDQSWTYVDHALRFFRQLPVTRMRGLDDLSSAWCFAETGEEYVVYQRSSSNYTLELDNDASYSISWYNPRTGETSQGDIISVTGPGMVDLGTPPAETSNDWAAHLLRIADEPNIPPVASFDLDPITGTAPLLITVDASGSFDPDGTISSYAWDFGDGNTATGEITDHTYENIGTFTVTLTVTDNEGATHTASREVIVEMSTDTETLSTDERLTLFPNPAKQRVTLNWPGTEQALVRVRNLQGQLLQTIPQLRSGDLMDVSNLPAATYLLEVVLGDRKLERILIIE